jgi:site-specific DNA recombinase
LIINKIAMKKALIYCRVSTEEQAKNNRFSLDAQQRICKKSAKDSGYRIIEIFIDPGKSATNMNRPGLQDMLIRCQEDESINAVFVQDTDRIARNLDGHIFIKKILKKADVKLVSVSQPTIDDSAEGNMVDNILASINQFQSELTGRKTLKGMEEKVLKGGWPRPAPLGYTNFTDNKENKVVVIDEYMSPLVIEGFKLYSTGSYSVQFVADKLYGKGLRSKTGKRIQNSRMTALLKNRFYIGEVNWKHISIKGNHEPLISEKVFNVVQEIIKSHNHNVFRSRKYSYLLSGYIYCDICKSRYTGETHPEKNAVYYRCTKRINHREKFSRANELEKQVEEQFEGLEFSNKFIELVVRQVKELFNEKRKGISKRKKSLENQKTAIERRRDIAEDKLFRGIISDEDFERNKVKFNKELLVVQSQIDEIERIRNVKIDEVQKVLKLTRNIYKAYKDAPNHLKSGYLNLFWDKFYIQDGIIINAVPTKIFKALQDDFHAFYSPNSSFPVPEVVVGGSITQNKNQLSTSNEVRIADFWGG